MNSLAHWTWWRCLRFSFPQISRCNKKMTMLIYMYLCVLLVVCMYVCMYVLLVVCMYSSTGTWLYYTSEMAMIWSIVRCHAGYTLCPCCTHAFDRSGNAYTVKGSFLAFGHAISYIRSCERTYVLVHVRYGVHTIHLSCTLWHTTGTGSTWDFRPVAS